MKCLIYVATFSVFSIAAIPTAVKAQSSNATELHDSIKSEPNDFSKLIQTLMTSGRDFEYANGFAQAVGLDGPKPAKVTLEVINGKGYKCHVLYTNDNGTNRPYCVYFVRAKKWDNNLEEQYFRVSLDGKLEKAITLRNKMESGKAIREGRSKSEEDIDSPEIKKAFTTDMKFWVKDWLKRQQKLAKKDKAAAESAAK